MVRYKLYPELLAGEVQDKDFTPDELERSYNGLFMLIDELLHVNPNLVIITDGTFRTEAQRAQLVKISERNNCRCIFLKTEVEEDIIVPRLEQRFKDSKGADIENYRVVKPIYEEPQGENVFKINNNGSISDLQNTVNKTIKDIIS